MAGEGRIHDASMGALIAGVCLALLLAAPSSSQEFGTITFPTSGAPAAQGPFLTG